MKYDIVIIGGGIAGLYCGHKILRDRPDLTFTILERSPRNESDTEVSAGRLGSTLFEGSWISCGGGIGIEDCVLLLELLTEYKIDYTWFNIKQRTDQHADISWFKSKVSQMKSECKENNGLTFYEFAMNYLTHDEYSRFMFISGYRDYENNDNYHVFNYYMLNDNVDDGKAFASQWGLLISALYRRLDGKIQFQQEVHNILPSKNDVKITYGTNNLQLTTKVVINATAIDGIRKLFSDSVFNHIDGQSESRIYVKVEDSKTLVDTIKDYQIVHTKNILQKIIPILLDEKSNSGIVLASYCDNLRADTMSRFIENTAENRTYLSHLIDDGLRTYNKIILPTTITNLKGFYHNISVHIFKPLSLPMEEFINKIQFPAERIFVVGEVVARKHGWVESALNSTAPLFSFLNKYFTPADISRIPTDILQKLYKIIEDPNTHDRHIKVVTPRGLLAACSEIKRLNYLPILLHIIRKPQVRLRLL